MIYTSAFLTDSRMGDLVYRKASGQSIRSSSLKVLEPKMAKKSESDTEKKCNCGVSTAFKL